MPRKSKHSDNDTDDETSAGQYPKDNGTKDNGTRADTPSTEQPKTDEPKAKRVRVEESGDEGAALTHESAYERKYGRYAPRPPSPSPSDSDSESESDGEKSPILQADKPDSPDEMCSQAYDTDSLELYKRLSEEAKKRESEEKRESGEKKENESEEEEEMQTLPLYMPTFTSAAKSINVNSSDETQVPTQTEEESQTQTQVPTQTEEPTQTQVPTQTEADQDSYDGDTQPWPKEDETQDEANASSSKDKSVPQLNLTRIVDRVSVTHTKTNTMVQVRIFPPTYSIPDEMEISFMKLKDNLSGRVDADFTKLPIDKFEYEGNTRVNGNYVVMHDYEARFDGAALENSDELDPLLFRIRQTWVAKEMRQAADEFFIVWRTPQFQFQIQKMALRADPKSIPWMR